MGAVDRESVFLHELLVLALLVHFPLPWTAPSPEGPYKFTESVLYISFFKFAAIWRLLSLEGKMLYHFCFSSNIPHWSIAVCLLHLISKCLRRHYSQINIFDKEFSHCPHSDQQVYAPHTFRDRYRLFLHGFVFLFPFIGSHECWVYLTLEPKSGTVSCWSLLSLTSSVALHRCSPSFAMHSSVTRLTGTTLCSPSKSTTTVCSGERITLYGPIFLGLNFTDGSSLDLFFAAHLPAIWRLLVHVDLIASLKPFEGLSGHIEVLFVRSTYFASLVYGSTEDI